ncbi:hypothetical protein GBAR_LOCUS26958, partial [Geodia barretti]
TRLAEYSSTHRVFRWCEAELQQESRVLIK